MFLFPGNMGLWYVRTWTRTNDLSHMRRALIEKTNALDYSDFVI